ncbi:MAG TPA: hypothetical protein VHK68_07895 [Gemmatimonadales bacterium]|nr:hypothetical protein [Gemmatimonadales bacterium]
MEENREQITLFTQTDALPPGFRYQPELLGPEEEQHLLDDIRQLPFKEFLFQGFVGKRRVVSYGWQYDFNERALRQAQEIPAFLLPLREAAASFARLVPEQLAQVLLTEYDAGATIGWHRDKSVFGDVVGISLVSACAFVSAARSAAIGCGPHSRRSRARSTYSAALPARNGSTAFRPLTLFGIR